MSSRDGKPSAGQSGGWRPYYCRVCGHIEWLAPGDALDRDFRCPLCDAPRPSFVAMDGDKYASYRLSVVPITSALLQVDRLPGFPRDWQHYSYLIVHPEGTILFDAPPIITPDAIDAVRRSGVPRCMVVSHKDFLGPAQLWAEALGIEIWMGADDPIGRNRVAVARRITAPTEVLPGVEVIPVPGHSPGSVALYWPDAPGGPALCAGDALAVSPDREGRVQLAYFQAPPAGREIAALTTRPVETLAACGGVMRNAARWLRQLANQSNNCARPWMGERGGLWIDAHAMTG